MAKKVKNKINNYFNGRSRFNTGEPVRAVLVQVQKTICLTQKWASTLQKCRLCSIFLITCVYLLIYSKIVTNIVMGFKIWCQVGGGGTQFSKLPNVREFSSIWFQKSSFFFLFFFVIIHFFWKSQKRFFQCIIEKSSVLKLWPFFLFFSEFRRKLGTG